MKLADWVLGSVVPEHASRAIAYVWTIGRDLCVAAAGVALIPLTAAWDIVVTILIWLGEQAWAQAIPEA